MFGAAALAWVALHSSTAWAGVPECGGMRVESAVSCKVTVSASCEGQCELDVYKKACATELRTVCSQECTAPPDTQCTTDCGEICEADCSNGVSLICVHNCFDECTATCSASCEDAEDPGQCRASCEANCNGECDAQCAIVEPDDSCMKHCLECCDGSCRAIANMDCQITCQEEEFESCEYGMQAKCDGGCMADGSLFCDGEFVMSGWAVGDCVTELRARGVYVDVQVDVDLDDVDVGFEDPFEPASCSVGGSTGGSAALATVLTLGLFGLLRRRPA